MYSTKGCWRFIIVRLEKNGNYKIEDIIFQKKIIHLIINGETIKISATTYSHFYLYKGRILSQNELDEIIDYQNRASLRDYAFTLLSKRMYSKKQLETKLIAKKAKKEEIEELISYLEEQRYINDEEYANDLFDAYEKKNFGKNKIIEKMKENGVPEVIINKMDFVNEKEKMIYVSKKFILSHKEYNYMQLKNGLYRYLLNDGFEFDDVNQLIDILLEDYVVDENELLEKSMRKYISLHKLDINVYEDKEKIIAYMLRKGYKYENINNVLRRLNDEVYK